MKNNTKQKLAADAGDAGDAGDAADGRRITQLCQPNSSTHLAR